MPARKRRSKRRSPRRRWPAALRRHPWRTLAGAAVLLSIVYAAWLDWRITSRFEGRRWDLPAQVYARPLELHEGLELAASTLEQELERLGYREAAAAPSRPGSYRRRGSVFEVLTREFRFWDGPQRPLPVFLEFGRRGIERIVVPEGVPPVVRLDPLLVGSVFPAHGEDRLVITPSDVPPLLRAGLVAVEDRRFHDHPGVDVRALGRAFVANVKAGGIAQGGSTLTQQLVKNYFLDNRQTLSRKLREALMALILELHYEKPEILNAYVNEVYLGQDGQRAIHGFGLASQFWFSRPLDELELHQLALLVALVRGPGYYDPDRHPERALARRNLVLDRLAEEGHVSDAERDAAARRSLDTWDRATAGASYYPAYLGLVRRELADDFPPDTLTREGLKVFTALDPRVQASAEKRLAEGLEALDARQPDRSLAGAVVVTNPRAGEVLAVVGDRRAGYEGFNRALAARRPIGSLVKAFVYLAAIESGRFSLASTVADDPVSVPLPTGETWEPENFSEESHGDVTLVRGLAESLNLATVNLGLDVGVEAVAGVVARLGSAGRPAALPSLLLGAVEMSPFEVADLYGTLANDGFRAPATAVRSVVGAAGEPLDRYPLSVSQALEPAHVYQVNEGLVAALERGTGRSAGLAVRAAGKTGTSDDFRDSWFAGFTGDRLAVVWIGFDDFAPTGLSGAAGALPVWNRIMADTASRPYAPPRPAGLSPRRVDYYSGAAVGRGCTSGIELSLPAAARLPRGGCSGAAGIGERALEWLNGIIN